MSDAAYRAENPPEPLTEREREILVGLAEGLSNKEIANRLFLAEKTVRWYNSQIYAKLGVNGRAEAVEQAHARGLLAASQAAVRHNLPANTTPFIGRRGELADLAALLDRPDTRLVTIHAPGGMGKTRLAIEAARAQIGNYPDGVFFIPLAPLGSPDDIVTAIAENLGLNFHGPLPLTKQLADLLRDRAVLLVLDNFEHLLSGTPLVTEIIQTAPHVKVLATARERLNLSAETVYVLSGLNAAGGEAPEDAATLFVQSAERLRPGFRPQADESEHIRHICRLTEGMPLAIELAAGWVDVLPVEQIATEIQRGFDILETELRDVPERHRSIRATFERTWERLDAGEQVIFARLSVFRGGFTPPAAQAVAGASARALRLLAQKALVQNGGSDRFAIHELLRQFGAEQLGPGDSEAAQAAHAAYFVNFMAQREEDVRTSRQFHAAERIAADFENVRTAWLHLVRQGEWERLRPFLYPLWFCCDARGRGQEYLDLLEAALNAVQSAPASPVIELTRGRILSYLSWAYGDVGLLKKGAAAGDEAIRILRRHPDGRADLVAACCNRHKTSVPLLQVDVSAASAEEGLEVARAIGDTHLEGHLLVWLADACVMSGAYERALAFAQQGLALLESRGDQGLLMAYNLMGHAHLHMSQIDEAKRRFEQASAHAERYGAGSSVGVVRTRLGELAVREGDFASARRHLRLALHWYWNTGRKWLVPFTIVSIARAYTDQSDDERAVEVLAAVDPHLFVHHYTDKRAHALRAELEVRVEPERFAAAWARGSAQQLGALVADLLAELAGDRR